MQDDDSDVRRAWANFRDGLLHEWKLYSGICSVILTINGAMSQLPAISNSSAANSLWMVSMVDCLFCFAFAITYRTRLHIFTTDVDARGWLQDAKRVSPSKWQGPTILLAAPAAWCCWACISFVVLVFILVWDNSTVQNDNFSAASFRAPYFSAASAIVVTIAVVAGTVHLLVNVPAFYRLGESLNGVDLEIALPPQGEMESEMTAVGSEESPVTEGGSEEEVEIIARSG
ncbi:uncharacterized protein LAESUDRAFT_747428 [Laetiporus sulphureus 93-53]|uniref:Uncharacterized protein n=1 Tax=Laetiporus sulphureus 93-53 TaxID=1314785 RepID=A0A165GTL2_9APHY|nr:uncharacterized protein LAESUDRAFT_747428 [Laetiporus sulphureus 93-53]KZT10795.1 hypothetical protein LAESUDRAFT_747428 [Laetiporus sulphureus 93-53]